jgi:hypothetical protein
MYNVAWNVLLNVGRADNSGKEGQSGSENGSR